ncbi:class I SAM-dependent methyltransferase, partial [Patescibacteria group bacterium]|nr:class I SAM-dependent methyltransferase [Patescibacteria group bacterium]
ISMESILLPFDVFERHQTVAKKIKPGETVLDVGGGVDALGKFIKNKIIIVNLQSGDILTDGRELPLKDNSFDVATSIDVLEHVPQKDRKIFIGELLRVAKKKVILSVPLGTKGHIEAEKKLLKIFETKKMKSGFLKEHLERGLPTFDELKSYLSSFPYKVFYSGDYRLNSFLVRFDLKSFKNPKLDKFIYFLKRSLNVILNLFYFPFSGSEKPEKFTNRIYLFIEKK